MKKVILLIIAGFLYANEYLYQCEIDYTIMYAIAATEGHGKREIGYPYLISLNQKITNKKEIKKKFHIIFLDKRSIDCKNKNTCVALTHYLVNKEVKNIDLGAFQINYIYHPLPIEVYFDLKKSYKYACFYIEKLVKKYGYTWSNIAKYHSFNRGENKKYLKRLQQNYIKYSKGAS